jgi:hypothetical protein
MRWVLAVTAPPAVKAALSPALYRPTTSNFRAGADSPTLRVGDLTVKSSHRTVISGSK